MAKAAPFIFENQINAYKSNDYPQKAKGMSFAFVFSIFIFISIFYIINISPSTLLNNHKFWFFISNTLILIIAADYGTFSSCKQKRDLYKEYMINSQARNTSSFGPKYQEILEKNIPKEDIDDLLDKKEVIVQKKQVAANFMDIVINSEFDIQEKMLEHAPKIESECCDKKNIKSRNHGRSKFDKGKSYNNIFYISEAENNESRKEDNEFSNMSSEELNRRVEEFIERCNRQIRLQNATTYQRI
ncbi:DUF761 domain-containing protein [Cephalotus follicularis]|uniref:DUF761 domain-containing protein n=1 Tax=Cephalotus follicularis TaxID=3775 RepID=A0A1Q3D9Q8_CEPFO|nr:DUF761 domain-containing protein [Cephalotus follicularis]